MHRSEAPQVSYPNLALSFQSCSWITLGINAIMMIIPLHLQSLRGAEGTVTGYTYCWITVVSAQVREEDDRAQCWNMGIAHEKSLCPVALCPSLCSSASSRIAPSVRPQHGSRFVMELIAIPCQEKDENQGGIRYRGGLYRALADLFVVFFGMGFLKEENYTRSPKGANGRGPHTWGRHFFWGVLGLVNLSCSHLFRRSFQVGAREPKKCRPHAQGAGEASIEHTQCNNQTTIKKLSPSRWRGKADLTTREQNDLRKT